MLQSSHHIVITVLTRQRSTNSITPIIISENKKQIYSSISNGPKTQQQGIKKGHLYQPVDFSMRLPKTIFLEHISRLIEALFGH